MAITASSFAVYQSDGSAVNYAVPFPFISRKHVRVFLGWNPLGDTFDRELDEGTDFTWQTDGEIRLTTAAPAGTVVAIVRFTPTDDGLSRFHDGSYLIAEDLNLNTQQVLYATQEAVDRSREAGTTADASTAASAAATATANQALSTATTAAADATAAEASAHQAATDAATAKAAAQNAEATAVGIGSKADQALAAATAAETEASTAAAAAAEAKTTADAVDGKASTALADAAAAKSIANGIASTANTALTTANAAKTAANAAQTTANTAESTASSVASTANAAQAAASAAQTTANAAESTANSVAGTAQDAKDLATQALDAISQALPAALIPDVASIPSSPANDEVVDVRDSTGIESFRPLTGLPAGFTGSPGLTVRLHWDSGTSTWEYRQYQPNDPEDRYVNRGGDSVTGEIRSSITPSSSNAFALVSQVNTADVKATTAYDKAASAASAASDADAKAAQAVLAASDADAKATQAASDASDADAKATQAASAASAADAKATQAASAASAADTKATAADTKATQAQSTATTAETTADAAKAAADAATSSLDALSRTRINAGDGLTGGGDLRSDRTLALDVATQAEAEAGTDNVKGMTPLRTAQAIAALTPAAPPGGAQGIQAELVTASRAITDADNGKLLLLASTAGSPITMTFSALHPDQAGFAVAFSVTADAAATLEKGAGQGYFRITGTSVRDATAVTLSATPVSLVVAIFAGANYWILTGSGVTAK